MNHIPTGAWTLILVIMLLTITTAITSTVLFSYGLPTAHPGYLVFSQLFVVVPLTLPMLLIALGRSWALGWLKINCALPALLATMALFFAPTPAARLILVLSSLLTGAAFLLLRTNSVAKALAFYAHRRDQRQRWGKNNRELLRRYHARVEREAARERSSS